MVNCSLCGHGVKGQFCVACGAPVGSEPRDAGQSPISTSGGVQAAMGDGSLPPRGMPAAEFPTPTGELKRSWQQPVLIGVVTVAIVITMGALLLFNSSLRLATGPVAATATPSPSVTGIPSRILAPDSAAPDVPTLPEKASSSLPTSVGPYVDGFVQAWGVGDSQAASRYATEAAVASLFQSARRGGNTWAYESSTALGSRTQVLYADGSGRSLHVLVDNAMVARGAGQAVMDIHVEVGNAIADWPPYPGPVSLGDRGDRVRQWQNILIQKGIISNLSENRDGFYGNATSAAVDRYLSGRNLVNPDGGGNLGQKMYDLITG